MKFNLPCYLQHIFYLYYKSKQRHETSNIKGQLNLKTSLDLIYISCCLCYLPINIVLFFPNNLKRHYLRQRSNPIQKKITNTQKLFSDLLNISQRSYVCSLAIFLIILSSLDAVNDNFFFKENKYFTENFNYTF